MLSVDTSTLMRCIHTLNHTSCTPRSTCSGVSLLVPSGHSRLHIVKRDLASQVFASERVEANILQMLHPRYNPQGLDAKTNRERLEIDRRFNI